MATGYREVQRDQQFLMPPDMREWLPADHLVHTVLALVAALDTAAFHVRSRLGGPGRQGYDPDMLLGLLVFAYCMGERSTRRIEALCSTNVAFRFACAQDVPDHTVLARFRKVHEDLFEQVFADVLVMAAGAGLVVLETVAVDGTKIAANASLGSNRNEEWVRARATEILAEADAVDAAEDERFGDARGDEVPEELADPDRRQAKIDQMIEELNKSKRAKQAESAALARQQAARAAGQLPPGRSAGGIDDQIDAARRRLEIKISKQEAAIAEWQQRKAADPSLPGQPPRPVADCGRILRLRERLTLLVTRQAEAAAAGAAVQSAAPAQVNTTDPQSRIMKTRNGWVQGYNVQLAVSHDQIILAGDVSQSHADTNEFVPMMRRVEKAAAALRAAGHDRSIGIVLADAGYASTANVTAAGPSRLIATGKAHKIAKAAAEAPRSGPPDPKDSPLEQMRHTLATPEGAARYKRRGATVEPGIGNLKKLMDRFSRRGQQAAQSEFHLTAAAFNILKIHRAQLA